MVSMGRVCAEQQWKTIFRRLQWENISTGYSGTGSADDVIDMASLGARILRGSNQRGSNALPKRVHELSLALPRSYTVALQIAPIGSPLVRFAACVYFQPPWSDRTANSRNISIYHVTQMSTYWPRMEQGTPVWRPSRSLVSIGVIVMAVIQNPISYSVIVNALTADLVLCIHFNFQINWKEKYISHYTNWRKGDAT